MNIIHKARYGTNNRIIHSDKLATGKYKKKDLDSGSIAGTQVAHAITETQNKALVETSGTNTHQCCFILAGLYT